MSELLTDIPFSEYLKLPGLSQSVLKLMERHEPYGRSPKHAKATYDGLLQKPDSKAKRFGRAEHAWILEGETAFREQFVVMPDGCCVELKSGQRKGERCNVTPSLVDRDGNWFCGKHRRDWMTEPDNAISAADVARIEAMAAAVKSSEINAHLSRPGGSSEATILYDVEVSTAIQVCPACSSSDVRKAGFEDWLCKSCDGDGFVPRADITKATLPMKARLDRLLQPYKRFPHMVVDLKRHGGDWTERKIQWAIRDYGYDVQAAQYTEAVREHYDVEACDYLWVFVEPTFPHDVAWYLASEDDLRIGGIKLKRYREEWARCSHTEKWPGIQQGIPEAGGLPATYVKNFDKGEA